MSGTREGGYKTAATMYRRYGLNVYELIGRSGGAASKGGGFNDRELAKEAGRRGGLGLGKGQYCYRGHKVTFTAKGNRVCSECRFINARIKRVKERKPQ